jgi:hypothetical protein
MKEEMYFEKYKTAFDLENDGFLRDVYIEHTTIYDWEVALTYFYSNGIYKSRLLIDNEDQPSWPNINELFLLKQDHAVSLRIDEEYLDLHCYFFDLDEIELDFDPHNIQDTAHLKRLLAFIHSVGNLLQKIVILTPESSKEIHYLSFDPKTGVDVWSLPEFATYHFSKLEEAINFINQTQRLKENGETRDKEEKKDG